MKKIDNSVIWAIIITILFSYSIAYMKLKQIWLGKFFLDYLFLPMSLFLAFDGIISMRKNERYFSTRLIRVIIGTVIFTIHVYILFFR